MGVQGLEFGGNEKKYLILNLKTIKKDLWNANREFTGMTRRRNRWQRGWTVNSLLYPRDQRHPKRKAEDTDEWVKSMQSPWDLLPTSTEAVPLHHERVPFSIREGVAVPNFFDLWWLWMGHQPPRAVRRHSFWGRVSLSGSLSNSGG